MSSKSVALVTTAAQAFQIVGELYRNLKRPERKKFLALLVRECCGVVLQDDAITPENAEDWLANLVLDYQKSNEIIADCLPLVSRAERITRKEDYPDRNAAIRDDRKRKLTLAQIALKHHISIAAVRSVLRRSK